MYVYQYGDNYVIMKNKRNYCSLKSKELADFVVKMLDYCNWNVDLFPTVLEFNGNYYNFLIDDGRIYFLSDYPTKEEAFNNYVNDADMFADNPNNSKYGAYIYQNGGIFTVSKNIDHQRVVFGYSKTLDEAKFVKSILVENDWDISNLENIYFNKFNFTYDIIGIYNENIHVLESFESYEDALNNLESVLEKFEKKTMLKEEPFIYSQGDFFFIRDGNNKFRGTFKSLEDACCVRDFLISNDWSNRNVDPQDIHELNGFYWRFIAFNNNIKIVAKYSSFDDAFLNQNNLSDFSIDDFYDTENPYAPINRNIWKRDDEFHVLKRIDGEFIDFGCYSTKKEAIKARDEFEANNWVRTSDKDSVFYDGDYDDSYLDIINSLSMWQKLIYDSIDGIEDNPFTFDDLINQGKLNPYRRGNFNTKVQKYLDEVVDLGLVDDLKNGQYKALWK